MPTSPSVAVIADDLTGALDATVPFANAGLRCVVATAPLHLEAALRQGADVVAVSTNSRDLSGPVAAQAVAAAAMTLHRAAILFKKIDSRLKGNIAAEVGAAAAAQGLRQVLICPAIPQMGRVVTMGQLRGHGVAAPLQVLDCLAGQGLEAMAPDAETDADIDDMLASLPPRCLLVGASGLSAGLARQMARGLGDPVRLPLPRPVAIVIGSRDPITLAQVDHLRQSQPEASYVAAPNGVAALPKPCDLLIVQATAGAPSVSPQAVSRALGEGLSKGFDGTATLVLTGGETAAAVLAALGLGVLDVLGEALAGVPVCRASGQADAPLILTKSGGFGGPDTLNRLISAMPKEVE